MLERSRRGPTRRAREGKGIPGRLSEGVGAGENYLKFGGLEEEAEVEKGVRGGLLRLVQSST